MAREQDQFLDVVDRDTAEKLWWETLRPQKLDGEAIPLSHALGRILAEDVVAQVDVPSFDRSNVDGYALRGEDTFGASEENPIHLYLNAGEIPTGVVPQITIEAGTATAIATGAMIPRGADAVLMIEHARIAGNTVHLIRPVAPGSHLSFAGTDISRGELVLRRGTKLTARETGMLAAIGQDLVNVIRKPRVAIISTGDEVIAPGTPSRPGTVYDANGTLLADAIRELGGEPVSLGIVGDDEQTLSSTLDQGLSCADVVLLSGGTSKGGGDLSYRILVNRTPGIVVHGVALKPGKPICLGAVASKPVAILPGFPTSAIFTFHEFVAPLLRHLAGTGEKVHAASEAKMAMRINSERGRTEYLLVNLVHRASDLIAYPMGKGSGSVTTFSRADGFVVIPRQQEYVDQGETVAVTLLGEGIEAADLVVIGSHCLGLEFLLGKLADQGLHCKTMWVGSQGGLEAVRRGECDLAGIHLLDPKTNTYNLPFLPEGVRLLRGYGRMQGFVFRPGDNRFSGCDDVEEALQRASQDQQCLMVNRNRGSGTRILLDMLLRGRRPRGYAVELKSHHSVAAAITQERADWGVAIAPVAKAYGLEFLPIRAEEYDFAIPQARWDKPAVKAFRILIDSSEAREGLSTLGFVPSLTDQ